MKTLNQILFSFVFSLICLFGHQAVFGEDLSIDDSETQIMMDNLRKEKEKLEKLKNSFDSATTPELQTETPTNIAETDYLEIEEAKEVEVEAEVEVESGAETEIITKKKNSELINPFELAESLYKMEEYESALDIYKLLSKYNQDEEMKMWILYQIANCYRKSRKFEDAHEAYTLIQKEYDGTYWAKQAQWFINEIEWRTEVKDKLEKIGEK